MLDKIRERVKTHIEHFGYQITSEEEDEIVTLYELNHDEYDENMISLHVENYMDRKKFTDVSSEESGWSRSRRTTVFAKIIRPENFDVPNFIKTKNTFDFLFSRLGTNIPFCLLSDEQKNTLVGSMFPIIVEPGVILIKEGDLGAEMYIIEEGEFEVSINGQFTNRLSPGSVFGELALLHGIPRTATVKALTKSRVWSAIQTSFSCIRMRDQLYRKGIAREVIQNNQALNSAFFDYKNIEKIIDSVKSRFINSGSNVILEDGEVLIVLKKGLIRNDHINSCKNIDVLPKDIINKGFYSITDLDCISLNLKNAKD